VWHFVCAARNKRNPARNLFCFIGKGTAYLLKDSVVVVPNKKEQEQTAYSERETTYIYLLWLMLSATFLFS
jgi:hypothetical protein